VVHLSSLSTEPSFPCLQHFFTTLGLALLATLSQDSSLMPYTLWKFTQPSFLSQNQLHLYSQITLTTPLHSTGISTEQPMTVSFISLPQWKD
jgi:hypothetical protein